MTRYVVYTSTNKTQIIRFETEIFVFFILLIFLPRADASHVYVGAWALGCFNSLFFFLFYPNLLEGADRVGGQLRGDEAYPFSGVTNSGRFKRTFIYYDINNTMPIFRETPFFRPQNDT